jgi:hypothetical protein
MHRIRILFKNPVTLIGTGFASFALLLFAAGILTGGFSLAQEETPTATVESQDTGTAAPSATDVADETEEASPDATEEAETPSDQADGDNKGTLRDEFLQSLADELGISVDELTQALSNVALDMVDQAVADGRITEDEAAAVRERIASGDFPLFPRFHHRFGPGHHFGFGCGIARPRSLRPRARAATS